MHVGNQGEEKSLLQALHNPQCLTASNVGM